MGFDKDKVEQKAKSIFKTALEFFEDLIAEHPRIATYVIGGGIILVAILVLALATCKPAHAGTTLFATPMQVSSPVTYPDGTRGEMKLVAELGECKSTLVVGLIRAGDEVKKAAQPMIERQAKAAGVPVPKLDLIAERLHNAASYEPKGKIAGCWFEDLAHGVPIVTMTFEDLAVIRLVPSQFEPYDGIPLDPGKAEKTRLRAL